MSTLVHVITPDRSHRHEGMIIREVVPNGGSFVTLPAELATFWGERCLMCGVPPAPGRVCENDDCRRPLHPQWPAVYCCDACALEDA